MKSALNFSLVLLLSAGLTVSAIDISGTFKPEFSITDKPPPDSSSQYVFQIPLRLMLYCETGNLDFELTWAPDFTAGNPALSGNTDECATHIFRITDPEERIFPSDWNGDESFSILHNLDRLNISLRTSTATLTAGRQAIYWGIAKSVSPVDFIAPIRYATVNTEYRTGVDAVRSVFSIGMMSELDAGYVAGKNGRFSESGCWLRGRFYMFRTDVTLLTACFRENFMIGGSLNRSVGEGTGWVEFAIVSTGTFSENKAEDSEKFWSISTGFDRSWLNASLYGYLEYHFNSPGSNNSEDYTDIIESSAWTKSGIYLLGKHYLCPGLSWTINPLLLLNANALVNLTDPSAYISISGEYSVHEDIVLNLGYNSGVGKEPDQSEILRSEFGSWPRVYFISSGYYF